MDGVWHIDELPEYDDLFDHARRKVSSKFDHEIVEGNRTEESNRRYQTWKELNIAFINLKNKFGHTDQATRLEFPCLFNETVRAKEYDTKPPLLPHGLQIPSGAQTTDPCSESVFVQSNAHGRRTLQRAVMKPTIEYSSAAFWHVPSSKPPKPQNADSMKMIGEEAKGKSKPTLLNDGLWMESAPDWIKENFHLRFVDFEQDYPLYNS